MRLVAQFPRENSFQNVCGNDVAQLQAAGSRTPEVAGNFGVNEENGLSWSGVRKTHRGDAGQEKISFGERGGGGSNLFYRNDCGGSAASAIP